MYLAVATRPDIAYSTSFVARAMDNPTVSDWSNVKRIFKYLRGTPDVSILYQRDLQVELSRLLETILIHPSTHIHEN